MIIASSPLTLAATDEDREARPIGEVSPDKALVYLIRPSAYAGKLNTTFVYSDQGFLGTVDNSSYGFGYVEPGEHLLWSVLGGGVNATQRFECAPGRTYFLVLSPLAIDIVSEEQGRNAITEARSYKQPTDDEIETSKKHLEKKWARAQKEDAAVPRVAVAKMVAETPPADVTGKVRIPRGTTIKLELLENVSTAWSQPGDAVRFRAVDGLVLEGTTFLYPGTIVEAKLRAVQAASGSGRAGFIDIAFPGLRTADGSPVPLFGQATGSGRDRQSVSTGWAAGLGGILGGIVGAAIKGGEVLIPVGAYYDVSTPVDIWVDPSRATPPAPAPAGVALPELDLPSSARAVECGLKTACRNLDDVVIQVRSEQPLASIAIRAIDGHELPSPIPASTTKRDKDGSWSCTFPAWGVARHLPLREGTASSSLQLLGSLESGTAFRSDASVPLVVRQ